MANRQTDRPLFGAATRSGSAVGSPGPTGPTGPSAPISILNYAQTSSGQVTIANGSSFPFNIASVTITSTGNPIKVECSTDWCPDAASAWVRLQLFRGPTAIGQQIQAEAGSGGANANIPFLCTYIDTPPAGTYTYYCKGVSGSYGFLTGGQFRFGEAGGPVMSAIELASAIGPIGVTGATGAGITGATGAVGATGPAGSIGAPSDQFISVTRTNDSILTSAAFDGFSGATGFNNVASSGITFTPSTGTFTVSISGTYSITGLLIIIASLGVPDEMTITIKKNGISIWSYIVGIHTSVDPAPVTLQLFQTLSAGDTINISVDAILGAQVKAGSTMNITRLSVGPTGATGPGIGLTGSAGAPLANTIPVYDGTQFVAQNNLTYSTATGFGIANTTSIQQVQEKVVYIPNTNPVTCDWSQGSIFFVGGSGPTGPSSNFTVNITNLPTTTAKAYTVSLIIPQNNGSGGFGATGQVGGTPYTINWQNNTVPTISTGANKTDIETLTYLYVGGVTPWRILGNYVTYG